METKAEIRRRMMDVRLMMDVMEWQKATEEITGAVTALDWFREATDVYCYVDCRKEVGTTMLIREAWRLGKQVWAPKIRYDRMEFYRILSFEELTPGKFGILEPGGREPADGTYALVIVPGVAFDADRNRIGYGKGYYDRYIKAHPGLHTVAAAFDRQVLPGIPSEEFDVKPEILVTETRILES